MAKQRIDWKTVLIQPETHNKLKDFCEQNGYVMQTIVTRLIEDFIEDYNGLERER